MTKHLLILIKTSVTIVFTLILLAKDNAAVAQDATVYVSPHDMGKTLSNLYFSIDKNSFDYINTIKLKANPKGSDQFGGRVNIVNFETNLAARIIACEPTAALEFPLKIIVWEEEGDIYVSYINPIFFKRRYFVTGCDIVIQELNKSLIRVVNDAIRTQ